jgi:hypothetical protein
MNARPDGVDASADRARHDSRGLGSRRVRLFATAVTVVVHVVAVALYTSFADALRPDDAALPLSTDTDTDQGLEVIRLLELDEETELEAPVEPEEITDVEIADADARPPRIEGPVVGELLRPGPTAAERLRPRLRDPRLWARVPEEFFELTLEEREKIVLAGRIREWYDSLAAAGEAESRMTDWTFRDEDGGRWGFADGKIYLGDVALPFPFAFGPSTGNRAEANYRMWEFDEIERQGQRFLIEQTWKERAAAIRARRDKERAAAQRDTTGGR